SDTPSSAFKNPCLHNPTCPLPCIGQAAPCLKWAECTIESLRRPSTLAPAAVAGQQGLQPSRPLHPFVVAQTLAYFLLAPLRGQYHMPVAIAAFQHPHPGPRHRKRAGRTAPGRESL